MLLHTHNFTHPYTHTHTKRTESLEIVKQCVYNKHCSQVQLMRASVDFNKQILIEVLYCNGVQTMG